MNTLEVPDSKIVLPRVRRKLTIKGVSTRILTRGEKRHMDELLMQLEAVRMELGVEWLEISNRPAEDQSGS